MERPVLVTTKYRGVFFGYTTDTAAETIELKRARNAISWPREQKGFVGLATFGPLEGARVGPAADMQLRGVTAVVDVSPEAVERWEAAPWT